MPTRSHTARIQNGGAAVTGLWPPSIKSAAPPLRGDHGVSNATSRFSKFPFSNFFPNGQANFLPKILARFSNPPFSSPRHPRAFRRADPKVAAYPPFGPQSHQFSRFWTHFLHIKISSKNSLRKKPPKISKIRPLRPQGSILTSFGVPFGINFRCFFAKHRNLLNCNKHGRKLCFRLSRPPILASKIYQKTLFFRDTLLDLIFLHLC